MSVNLLELLNDHLSGDVVSKLADAIGESPKSTGTALTSAIPAVLAGLMQKGSDSQGASSLFNLITQGGHDGGILGNLAGMFGDKGSSGQLLSAGTSLLSTIFGNKVGGIADVIANLSGMGKGASSSLLGMLMPVVLGTIGKVIKSEGIGSAAGLASLLTSQSGFLKGLIPAGLSGILGMAGPALGQNVKAVAAEVEEEGGGMLGKLMPWLILAAALAIGWSLIKDYIKPPSGTPEIATPAVTPPAPPVAAIPPAAEVPPPPAAPVAETISNFFEKILSTGFAIKAAKDGVEGKLVSFIEDSGRVVDKTTWFTMDGITFDTGKATLRPESNIQLTNIAEILKAYPNVKIKIGGYTDNTGNAKANVTLSGNRAVAVQKALVAMGANSARIEAEGYGSEHPVAKNDTEEGRQQNRRIDVRVTEK